MRSRALTLAIGLLLVLAGCTDTAPSSGPGPSPSATAASADASGTRYVALGDSYTAAPYVYLTDVAKGCLRSNANYPAALASKLGAKVVDVSCSAATTNDLTFSQKTFQGSVPAQLDAVTPDTTLVTLGIGGNDHGLFASLSTGCPVLGPDGRPLGAPRAGTRCGQVNLTTAERFVADIRRSLTEALKRIHAKAPRATVVLVGYPRIASTTRTCPALLPASLADARQVDRVTRALNAAMRAAATATDSRFVDMYAASRGHDVCAGRAAWVNGVKTDVDRAAPLHPFAVEQQAVADRIAALLR